MELGVRKERRPQALSVDGAGHWCPNQIEQRRQDINLLGQPVDVGRGLAVSAVWAALFLVLYRVLWRAGLKRYSGMGA